MIASLSRGCRRWFSGGHHVKFPKEWDKENRKTIVLRNDRSGYYLDPNVVANRIMRLLTQHEAVRGIQTATLYTQWWELGLNELDYAELTVAIQEDFRIEIPDEMAEKIKDINEMVEFIARSYWAE